MQCNVEYIGIDMCCCALQQWLRCVLFGMLFKHGVHRRLDINFGYLEGADQPKRDSYVFGDLMGLYFSTWRRYSMFQCARPEEKEDDLNPTDDGKASEESHGASNETQLGLHLDLFVPFNVFIH